MQGHFDIEVECVIVDDADNSEEAHHHCIGSIYRNGAEHAWRQSNGENKKKKEKQFKIS